jgi:hypothetical protein
MSAFRCLLACAVVVVVVVVVVVRRMEIGFSHTFLVTFWPFLPLPPAVAFFCKYTFAQPTALCHIAILRHWAGSKAVHVRVPEPFCLVL